MEPGSFSIGETGKTIYTNFSASSEMTPLLSRMHPISLFFSKKASIRQLIFKCF